MKFKNLSSFRQYNENFYKRRNLKANWILFDEILKERSLAIEQHFKKKVLSSASTIQSLLIIFKFAQILIAFFCQFREFRNEKLSINWSIRFLKYFSFLMMFFFHETSSFNLKSSKTQISLNLVIWFFRL